MAVAAFLGGAVMAIVTGGGIVWVGLAVAGLIGTIAFGSGDGSVDYNATSDSGYFHSG